MQVLRAVLLAMLGASCASPEPGAAQPLVLSAVDPAIGSVAGGDTVTLTGTGFTHDTQVTIGKIPCTDVKVTAPERLTCTTGDAHFVESTVDVVAVRDAEQVALPSAYTYQCLWTTSSGRRSCGAVPPRPAPQPVVTTWITQFQAADGFAPNPDGAGASAMTDTSDFVLGDRSAWLETDGLGTQRVLSRIGGAPIDFTDQSLAVWIKVEDVAHVATFDVALGDSGLANQFRFQLRAFQSQAWVTEGDWVAITLPFAPDSFTVQGTPDRRAITDIRIRVADDRTGQRVRLHLNGIAQVAEPVDRFPQGVVSFTFDDNFSTIADGAALLGAKGFAATAYVIVDTVGVRDKLTLAQLHAFADQGWDISVHANTDQDHFAHWTTLTPQQVEDDMVDARDWLIHNGFAGYDHCAYPSGEFSTGGHVLPLARKYFTSCRTIFQGQSETFAPADASKLRVLYVTQPVTLATVEQAIATARDHREWLILVFHRLVPVPQLLTEWNRDDFATLVDYVAGAGIPVATVSNVLAP